MSSSSTSGSGPPPAPTPRPLPALASISDCIAGYKALLATGWGQVAAPLPTNSSLAEPPLDPPRLIAPLPKKELSPATSLKTPSNKPVEVGMELDVEEKSTALESSEIGGGGGGSESGVGFNLQVENGMRKKEVVGGNVEVDKEEDVEMDVEGRIEGSCVESKEGESAEGSASALPLPPTSLPVHPYIVKLPKPTSLITPSGHANSRYVVHPVLAHKVLPVDHVLPLSSSLTLQDLDSLELKMILESVPDLALDLLNERESDRAFAADFIADIVKEFEEVELTPSKIWELGTQAARQVLERRYYARDYSKAVVLAIGTSLGYSEEELVQMEKLENPTKVTPPLKPHYARRWKPEEKLELTRQVLLFVSVHRWTKLPETMRAIAKEKGWPARTDEAYQSMYSTLDNRVPDLCFWKPEEKLELARQVLLFVSVHRWTKLPEIMRAIAKEKGWPARTDEAYQSMYSTLDDRILDLCFWKPEEDAELLHRVSIAGGHHWTTVPEIMRAIAKETGWLVRTDKAYKKHYSTLEGCIPDRCFWQDEEEVEFLQQLQLVKETYRFRMIPSKMAERGWPKRSEGAYEAHHLSLDKRVPHEFHWTDADETTLHNNKAEYPDERPSWVKICEGTNHTRKQCQQKWERLVKADALRDADPSTNTSLPYREVDLEYRKEFPDWSIKTFMESEIPAQRLEEIIKKLGAVPMKTTNRAPVARQIINIITRLDSKLAPSSSSSPSLSPSA